MQAIHGNQNNHRRHRGAAAVFVLITLVVMMGMAALTVDVGVMYRARHEAQNSADAAAVAAAWKLLDDNLLSSAPNLQARIDDARQEAETYAALNRVVNQPPELLEEDVVVGYLADPNDPNEAISFAQPIYNTVQVTVRRDEGVNGEVNLYFAALMGTSTTPISASATASFKDGAAGFRVTEETGNAGLLPLALKKDYWDQLIAGGGSPQDAWRYDKESESVAAGEDGILELNVFPGAGGGQLPPGNFGTVAIGANNNSTARLKRQILHGITGEDLAFHGGELKLGEDGTLNLSGDPGLSAAIKDELEAIVGEARALPIFDQVSGPGNNATFRIVGFVGVRIMEVKLTGAMNSKRLVIQPAFVVDAAVLTGPQSGSSALIYEPVRLVR